MDCEALSGVAISLMSTRCPFFAHYLHLDPRISGGILIPNPNSNQCALITDAHSPCIMQLDDKQPSWRGCQRNPVNNGTLERQ